MARKIRSDISGKGLVDRMNGKTPTRKIRSDISGKGLVNRMTKGSGK
jgi:hypothetical protein